MAQVDTNVTFESADDQTLEIITNLARDLDTLDDRLKRLKEKNIKLSLNVKNGEVQATLNEN